MTDYDVREAAIEFFKTLGVKFSDRRREEIIDSLIKKFKHFYDRGKEAQAYEFHGGEDYHD